MKIVSRFCKQILLTVGVGLVAFSGMAQEKTNGHKLKQKNNLKAGTSIVFLMDVDNGGIMYYHQYTRHLCRLFDASASIGYLNAQRFDDADKTFTLNKTYVMLDATGYLNFWRSDRFALKIGAGPSLRHRSEIDLIDNSQVIETGERKYQHTNTKDVGGNALIENDFYMGDRVILGTRIGGHFYNDGTPLVSFGLNLGYKF